MVSATSVMISPAMNFDNYTNETLNFKARTYGGPTTAQATITISISTNNGSTWATLGTRIPGNTTLTDMTQFDISSYNGTQILIRFQTLGAGSSKGVGIDDINIRGITASTNDATSKVEAPTTQISAGNIASTTTTSGSTVSVFSFKVSDLGTSDGLATKVTQVKIKKSSGTADWTDHIAGATLWDGATQITTGTVVITDADITFPITSGNLDIANNSNRELTLKIWLNTTNIVDNSTMVFSVSQTSHGFTADASGSTFANDFGAAVIGNTMTVRVTATKLLFVQQPTTTNVSTAMTPNPTVKACDANNNTDLDYSTAVNVTSTGTLTGSPVAGSWSSGIATFSGLTHTASSTGLTLTAASTGITNATSNTFDISASTSCATDLIISEYVEGSSNNKYIEIYNNTGASVNLTNYKLQLFANGASSPTNDVTLSGTLANNSTIVYKNNLASIYGGAATVNSVCNFNGDDAIALYKISTSSYVDIFGRIGEDPGSAWTSGVFTTKAKTLVRNASVLTGVTANPASGFPTLSTEWTQYDIDDVSHLGTHTMTCLCTEPTTNSTGMSFSNISNSSLDITIATPGNGSKRIIVAREGSAVSFTPTDNTTYEANSIFSDAIDLGAGNKVVYNGSGTTATISGLNGNTTYYFKVYEYNCSEGSEDYYTGGTLLEGHTTTAVSPVTNLKVICQTNTTAEISWTSPVGDYDGVIIGMRNSTLVCHTMSGNASGYSGDVIFGAGTQYGSTTPYSYVVYKGTGTSVTVTGLTAGQPYQITAYAYKNATGSIWATTQPTTAIASLSTANVSNNIVLVDNAQLLLQWNNPGASCFDEVMIVANAGAAITTVPTGDGSAYTANLAYGSGSPYGTGFVVYKGVLSPQIITNLTNGTSYCFTWFTRNGTSWSSGVSACGTPAAVTTLYSGDLAIVAVNTQCESTGSNDEICFFAFKDITEGTSIDFTDNGYERLYVNKWASSEGTIRLTRNIGAPTIPKGTVICFQGAGSLQSQFEIYNCEDPDDANWTITSINNVGGTRGSYDLNVDDQIWIMQGGAWDNDGSLSTHNATYSGNVLYGWTATGWKSAPGYDDTKGSTLYPSSECFATNVSVTSYHSKVKYTGSMAPTTQFDWLLRLNNSSNWSGYSSNALYNAGGNNYIGDCITFDITAPISTTSGVWTGVADNDWFNCGNWENLRIPTGTSNVTIKSGAANNIVIDDGITSMPTAECNDFTLDNSVTLSVNHASSNFIIYGNLNNASTINFTNGAIHLKGNYTNTGTFNHSTAGTLFFDGSSPQNITGTANFYNLTINNTSSGVNLSDDITVSNNLTLTEGTINTGSHQLQFGTSTANRGGTLSRTSGYVNGNMKRWFTNATNSGTTGLFPIGATLLVNGGPNAYLPTQIEFTTAPTSGGSLTAKFETTLPAESDYYLGLPKTDLNDGMDPHQFIDNLPNEGFWIISAGDGLTSGEYTITLTGNSINTIGDISKVRVLKRSDYGTNWELLGNHGTISGVSVTRTGLTGFSHFAMGGKFTENPLPINLLNFSAKYNGSIVDLYWSTASETNNDLFTIERSADALSFNAISSIKGAGNSNSLLHYSAIDAFPLKGINYYRLKQTDYNSKYAFSNIISVNTLDNNCELEISQLYLQNNTLNITLNCIDSKIQIDIIDITGRIIYSKQVNSLEKSQNISIILPKLNMGVYFAKITSDKTVVVKKFSLK